MTKRALIPLVVVILAGCVTGRMVTPLHEAVRDGDMEMAMSEAERGANLDAMDEEGRTALHYVCANGDVGIAEWLLAQGPDVNLQDDNGDTPLHYAAFNCYASIAEMLLFRGADPGLENGDGQTPIDIAIEIQCAEMVALFESQESVED